MVQFLAMAENISTPKDLKIFRTELTPGAVIVITRNI